MYLVFPLLLYIYILQPINNTFVFQRNISPNFVNFILRNILILKLTFLLTFFLDLYLVILYYLLINFIYVYLHLKFFTL